MLWQRNIHNIYAFDGRRRGGVGRTFACRSDFPKRSFDAGQRSRRTRNVHNLRSHTHTYTRIECFCSVFGCAKKWKPKTIVGLISRQTCHSRVSYHSTHTCICMQPQRRLLFVCFAGVFGRLFDINTYAERAVLVARHLWAVVCVFVANRPARAHCLGRLMRVLCAFLDPGCNANTLECVCVHCR